MTHQQQDPLPLLQRILQPHTCLQVQMIRRLVQHQKRRLDEQCPRQRNPHPPASRKVPRLFRLHLLIKPKPVQDTRCPHLRHIRIQRIQPLINIFHPRLYLRPLLIHQPLGFLLQRCPLTVHLHHRLQRRHIRRRHLTVQKVDVDMLRYRNLTCPECLEQRGLPAPVWTQQTVPTTVVQLQIRILEQLVTVEEQRKLLEMNIPRLRM